MRRRLRSWLAGALAWAFGWFALLVAHVRAARGGRSVAVELGRRADRLGVKQITIAPPPAPVRTARGDTRREVIAAASQALGRPVPWGTARKWLKRQVNQHRYGGT